MVSNDELEFYQALSVILGIAFVWATFAWIRSRDRVRALQERYRKEQQLESEAELRRAVDTIAVEVERLGEGQRHLAKLFGEGSSSSALGRPRPPGSITPH